MILHSSPLNLMEQIGGRITEEESRELILQKHYDLVTGQLERYVQGEERVLYGIFETLFVKYAKSGQELDADRQATLAMLQGFLGRLGYL